MCVELRPVRGKSPTHDTSIHKNCGDSEHLEEGDSFQLDEHM